MNNPYIRCIVVTVAETHSTNRLERAPKPSELLPWADPYIAQLVHQLQDEVRGSLATAKTPRPTRASVLARRIKNVPK